MARQFLAPGPPGDLMQKLVSSFGGPQITAGQPEIGIDHADQRQAREMVALGDNLGADDDIVLMIANRNQQVAQPLVILGGIARQHDDAGLGEIFFHFFVDTFDAGTAGGKAVMVVTFRAGFRHGHEIAAMVAGQPAGFLMLDQPRRAARAVHAVAAGAA